MGDELTQQELKALLEYSPETGVFTWKKRGIHWSNKEKKWSARIRVDQSGVAETVRDGDVAGYILPRGYRSIKIKGKNMLAHRLAFLYMDGSLPEGTDHINQQRDDNRWSNLRRVSQPVFGQPLNQINSPVPKNRVISLGSYEDIGDAIKARKDAEKKFGTK